MNHTKEPWRLFEDISSTLIDEHGFLVAITHGYGVPIEDAITNAQRIVACVNACAGIRTEALESGLIKYLLNDAYMRTLNPFDPNPQNKMDMKYLGKPVYEEDFE